VALNPVRQTLVPTAFDIVALVTSRGGLTALSQILAALPADFPVPIVLLQHLSPSMSSSLPHILSSRTALRVKHALPGERLQAGTVYVGTPNWHLLVTAQGTLTLSQTAQINFTRPAADVLFDSIAEHIGQRAIAVVLTGTGKDGAAGIQHIKQRGGTTIAQDQATAEFFGMPEAAIATQAIDIVLPLDQIAATLRKLVTPS
jgi:two-component system chemotaxis response regulator CheB